MSKVHAQAPGEAPSKSGELSQASLELLENTGGLAQQEFSAAEERTEFSIVCLSALRRMHEGKDVSQAKELLEVEMKKLQKDPLQYAEGCCGVSELLNRWGSASAAYSTSMMECAVEYADESIRVFEQHGGGLRKKADMEAALFWKALNAATLGGNGGSERGEEGGGWTPEVALQAARESNDLLGGLVLQRNAPAGEGEGRLAFVEGVITFCEGNAMVRGHVPGGDEGGRRNFEEASGLFLSAHKTWTSEYGEDHPDTIKAATMLGVLNKMLGRFDQAIEWTRKEYQLRVKVWGARHPRTEKCRDALRLLLGDDDESQMGDQDQVMSQELAEVDRYSEVSVNAGEITWFTDPFAMEEKWSIESVMTMFAQTGVTAHYDIARTTLARLIITAKGGYVASNTFHNWRHAWSVTMTCYIMIQSPGVSKFLGPREKLSMLVATLCHDITHPGVNSDFLIKTADPMALKFPTPNCLELHHLDHTMQLLSQGSDTDILLNCSQADRAYIVELIRELILATDMGLHKHIVARLVHHGGPGGITDQEPSEISEADKRELAQGIVHASDLSGQALPPAIACQFGKRVLEEFHTQHEREVKENLQESVFMKDLHLPLAQAKTQLGFLHYVAAPLWKAISRLFPEFHFLYQNIMNRAHEIDFDNIMGWGALHGGLVAMNRRRSSVGMRRSYSDHNTSSTFQRVRSVGSSSATSSAADSSLDSERGRKGDSGDGSEGNVQRRKSLSTSWDSEKSVSARGR